MEKSRKGMEKSSGTTRTNHRSRSSLEKADSRTRKLTSHFRALSLKAPWNCTAMRDQKPLRLRCGVEAAGAAACWSLGIRCTRSLAGAREAGQACARGWCRWRAFGVEFGGAVLSVAEQRVTFKHCPEWRNWQTRWTQNPVVPGTVWVRPPPPGPFF